MKLLDLMVVLLSIFLRKLHTIFQRGCTILRSHQQCARVLISPHTFQHLLSFVFLIIAILTVVRWYIIVVLIYIPLMISDAEHFFIYLLAICMSSLRKCLFKSFSLFFFSWVICFSQLSWSSLYILDVNSLSDIWFVNIFSLSVCCLFILLINCFPCYEEGF